EVRRDRSAETRRDERDALRIDQGEADGARRLKLEQAGDDGLDEDGFTAARLAGDEQVRRARVREIGAGNVPVRLLSHDEPARTGHEVVPLTLEERREEHGTGGSAPHDEAPMPSVACVVHAKAQLRRHSMTDVLRGAVERTDAAARPHDFDEVERRSDDGRSGAGRGDAEPPELVQDPLRDGGRVPTALVVDVYRLLSLWRRGLHEAGVDRRMGAGRCHGWIVADWQLVPVSLRARAEYGAAGTEIGARRRGGRVWILGP